MTNAAKSRSASQRMRMRDRSTRSTTVVQALPTKLPPWVMVVLRTQQASLVVLMGLAATLLGVYGWTVYTQQLWGKDYRYFEHLKKQERQLTAGNETLKNQMAQQAELPTSGLVMPDPSSTIYLNPAPLRPPAEPDPLLSPPVTPTRPLGY